MAHTFSNVLVHVVFSTKERRALIDDSFRERLWAYMGGVARREFGSARIIGGTNNHVHALLTVRTSVSVAKAMERWKSLASGWVHKTIPGTSLFGWQSGYSAFSVSESNAAAVVRYIQNQVQHHRRHTFEEEYVDFLKKNSIEYDPEQVFG